MSAMEWSFLCGMTQFVAVFAGAVAFVYVLVRMTWLAFEREEAVRR